MSPRVVLLLAGLLLPPLPWVAQATDPPHTDGENCSTCHLMHHGLGTPYLNVVAGNANLCQSCHVAGGSASAKALLNADQAAPWPGLPVGVTGRGTSHRWDSGVAGRLVFLGGAATPSTGTLQSGGAFTGPYAKTYQLTIATAGSVGTALFNWTATTPGGGSGTARLTGTNVALNEGITVSFLDGPNVSFQPNDRWNLYVRTDLRNPTNGTLLDGLVAGQVVCSTCHDAHNQTNRPFDPNAPAYAGPDTGAGRHYQAVDNRADQMCLDCHAPRNVTNALAGSHPVGVRIPVSADYKNPTLLPLGKTTTNVLCETCHAVHFSAGTDGALVRLTNRLAVCVDCHTLADTTTPARHLNPTNAALWPGGQYGTTFPAITDATLRGACENCHQAHAWPVATNTATTYPKLLVEREENLCFTCHDADGPAAKNVKTDFAKLRHHPATDSEQRPGRVVECNSCHNPHKALAGAHSYTNTATAGRNLISPVLKGADGVAFNYSGLTNFQAVASNRYTYIAKSTGVTYEYQICLKCHSSYAYGTNLPPSLTPVYATGTATFTSGSATVTGSGTTWGAGMVGLWIARTNNLPVVYRITAVASATSLTLSPAYSGTTVSGQAYAMSGETDAAQEFSPMNKSGHPILTGLDNYPNSTAFNTPAKKGLQAAQLKAPWNVNVGTQTMMCTDCHNTDAATPAAQGPHGSAAQFMLRGPNAANWPNVTLANYTTSWCANCHVSVNNVHRRSDHTSRPCYVCHIVIPHGGKLSRLMADNDTMPARYAYNNTLNTSYLQGFTKNATNSYSSSNCRAQCHGEHSGRTPGENW